MFSPRVVDVACLCRQTHLRKSARARIVRQANNHRVEKWAAGKATLCQLGIPHLKNGIPARIAKLLRLKDFY
jgi:hypothetical protein